MKNLLKIAGVLGVLVLGSALLLNSFQSEKRARKAEEASEVADSLRREALQTADRLTHLLSQVQAQRDTIIKRDTVIKDRILKVLAEPVPDTCKTVVAKRDEIIFDQQEQISRWRGVSDRQLAATDSLLRFVVTPLRVSNDSLRSAVKLLQPRRYDILGRLFHPEIKPAAFGGLCTNGKPCAGVGVAITF